ncbi:hypothetical protein Tco_0080525 [Tanacetum coccineum]
MAGSDNDSDDASVHSEATIPQQQQNIQPQIITTVSNNNAKFPYLKKDEYEVWAMKMKYWITNNDMNIWKVIQNGNSIEDWKRCDGRVIILSPNDCLMNNNWLFRGNHRQEQLLLHSDSLKIMLLIYIIWMMLGIYVKQSKLVQAIPACVSTTSAKKRCHIYDVHATLQSIYSVYNSRLGSHRSWSCMIAGCDTEDAIEEGAAKIYNLITGANTKEVSTAGDAGEFALMGVTSEISVDSSKVGSRPHLNRFAKTDSMKAVPPPLSGDYTPLSDHTDLDESQMYYGTKSSTSGDSNSVSK